VIQRVAHRVVLHFEEGSALVDLLAQRLDLERVLGEHELEVQLPLLQLAQRRLDPVESRTERGGGKPPQG